MSSVAAQKWGQEDRVMIASVVQYQHHAPSGCLLAQQALEEALEGGGVENRAHHANELATVQADGANPSHPTSAVVPLARLPAERLGRPARSDSPSVARSCRSRRTTPRLLGRIAPPSPTAIHAVGDRSATPHYVRSPAGSQFASPQHPQSAACASTFSQRKERCNYIMMLHYLCRRV